MQKKDWDLNGEQMKKIVIGENFQGRKYDFRETCFGFVKNDRQLMLVEKDGQFSFVGGGIESGESKEQCLRREFLEESGFEIKSFVPLFVIDCFWLAAGRWPLESLANFFLIEIDFSQNPHPRDDRHKVHFVSFEQASDLLALPYQKKALEMYLEHHNF